MTNQKDQSDKKRFQDLDEDELLLSVSGGGLQDTLPVSSAPPSPASPKPQLQRSKSLPIPNLGKPSYGNFSPNEIPERIGHIGTSRDPIVVAIDALGRR